jgi:hypothetical protein
MHVMGYGYKVNNRVAIFVTQQKGLIGGRKQIPNRILRPPKAIILVLFGQIFTTCQQNNNNNNNNHV